MIVNTPFEHHVPTDMRENLLWRARAHKKVLEDPSYADVLRSACAVDPIFYVNGFLFTHDPRLKNSTKVPFILYPYQRDGLMEIFNSIGDKDLLIEKSRDMGATWLNIVAFEYLWHFHKGKSFLIVSRDADYVDAPDNPKTLFWKIDFIHENLPSWLMPPGFVKKQHRLRFHLKNPHTKSVIDGEATTDKIAVGDRRTAIFLDEFSRVEKGHSILSATGAVTNSRLFNSTPFGINNAFFDLKQGNIKKIIFFWTEHPEKSKGLYKIDEDGKLEIHNPKGYPKDYEPFEQKWRNKLDGFFRSPWFDKQCERAVIWQEIAQEILIDYLGSGHQFFEAEAVREAAKKFAREPMVVGDLGYDSVTSEPSEFREDRQGHLRLWVEPDREGNLTRDHKYVVGCDVSAGTGSSNSVACIYDMKTYEKVGEYANPYIRPEEFARQVVAISIWLHNAYLIWESNGVGRQFGARVTELGYGHIYYRKREDVISKKQTEIPGWWASKETKLVLLDEYRAAIEKQKIVNCCRDALDECLEYIYNKQGGVSHSKEDNKDDPTGAKDNHGDRVVADALAWRGITERIVPIKKSEIKIPIGSLAWRRNKNKKDKKQPNRELLVAEGW